MWQSLHHENSLEKIIFKQKKKLASVFLPEFWQEFLKDQLLVTSLQTKNWNIKSKCSLRPLCTLIHCMSSLAPMIGILPSELCEGTRQQQNLTHKRRSYFLCIHKEICSKVSIFYFNGPKRPSDNFYIICLLQENTGLIEWEIERRNFRSVVIRSYDGATVSICPKLE